MKLVKSARSVAGLLAVVMLTAGACSSSTDLELDQTVHGDALEARLAAGVVFLTMKITPAVSMNALYQGRVVLDDRGCLRLDSEDRHTVVWPKGYAFTEAGGAVRILDAGGGLVGRVGESFRLGGGEVTSLHDALGFTAADRELAESHCPGRYWIVGLD